MPKHPPAAHGGSHTGAGGCTLKEAAPNTGSHKERDISQKTAACGRTHAGSGEKSEKEAAAKKSCYGLTTVPIPYPPALLGERVKKSKAMECRLGKEGGGEVFF